METIQITITKETAGSLRQNLIKHRENLSSELSLIDKQIAQLDAFMGIDVAIPETHVAPMLVSDQPDKQNTERKDRTDIVDAIDDYIRHSKVFSTSKQIALAIHTKLGLDFDYAYTNVSKILSAGYISKKYDRVKNDESNYEYNLASIKGCILLDNGVRYWPFNAEKKNKKLFTGVKELIIKILSSTHSPMTLDEIMSSILHTSGQGKIKYGHINYLRTTVNTMLLHSSSGTGKEAQILECVREGKETLFAIKK